MFILQTLHSRSPCSWDSMKAFAKEQVLESGECAIFWRNRFREPAKWRADLIDHAIHMQLNRVRHALGFQEKDEEIRL